jgi:glycosyltransferase involved in cell wall biosynthesis
VRLTLLIDVLSPAAGGGAERVVLLLGRELARRGHDVSTVLPTNAHTAGALAALRADGFDVETHHALLPVDVRRRASDVWRLSRFVRERRPDVVSLHTGCQWLRLKDILSVVLAPAPCVVTVHGGEPFESKVQEQRTRRASRLTRRIVVHGSSVQRSLVAAGIDAGAIELVKCGVPEPAARPTREAARARLGIESGAFVIGTLGRLIPRKRVADVLAAFARLTDDGGRTQLLVGGDGPERAALERTLSGPHAEATRFLGALSDPSDLYAASDVFALPARHEAFGLVYLEAAQHGVPSIGASEDGHADAIEHEVTGLLVRPGAVDELARALERLRADEALRTRLGRAAEQRVREEFSVTAMADGYLRAFATAGSKNARAG